MNDNCFEDVRPYYDSEVEDAIKCIADNVVFSGIVKFLFPEKDLQTFIDDFKKIKSVYEFQSQIMDGVIRSILAKTTESFSHSGFDKLTNEKSYLFISNHRDILLDSAILQIFLLQHNLKTSEITFGSNLMISQLIIDIGKLNKMFKIVRGGTKREIFNNSLNVSKYMRYALNQKQQSVWIAQRNGRAKNGFDSTEIAVLKMFAMSSSANFVQNLKELNITPIAVSYEYEPCDFLKTRELYISKQKQYIKDEGEDLNSIIQGVRQYKGNVFISVCPTITEEELRECAQLCHNDKYKLLAEIIDKKIYNNYKLWKTNYIAHDLLHNSNKHVSKYSKDEKESFKEYMNKGLRDIYGDLKELENIFLKIYATPVDNCG